VQKIDEFLSTNASVTIFIKLMHEQRVIIWRQIAVECIHSTFEFTQSNITRVIVIKNGKQKFGFFFSSARVFQHCIGVPLQKFGK
jgi:hypothetical protein